MNIQDLSESGFDPVKRTKIVIGGYRSKHFEPWLLDMKDALLELEDVNVVLVSWNKICDGLYDTVVSNVPHVARQITIFLYYLAKMTGTDIKDHQFTKRIHFIGHSLGAHIAGFVGKDLGGKLGRITGLDPAGPSFDKFSASHRLDSGDALLVDVFHTNKGTIHYPEIVKSFFKRLFSKKEKTDIDTDTTSSDAVELKNKDFFGIDIPIGHLNYYVNNGKAQPGCGNDDGVCDHGIAVDVFQDILRHGAKIQQRLKAGESFRPEDRLLAFRGRSYADFIVGANLAQFCAPYITRPNSNMNRSIAALKSCSVPIDPMADVDSFRQELKEVYRLDLSSASTSNIKFFFKTRVGTPLVGDHYLLKMYLETSPWENDCAFKVSISDRHNATKIRINGPFQKFNLTAGAEGIAMPFIMPSGIESHLALNSWLREGRMDENQTTYAVPDKIQISVTNSSGQKKRCAAYIGNIEIQPIRGDLLLVSEYSKFYSHGAFGPSVLTELLKGDSLVASDSEPRFYR